MPASPSGGDSSLTGHDAALAFLQARINYERMAHMPSQADAYKLDRMRRLLALVGDPHLALRAVHIAGTKGKGSTAAMLACVLQEAGYRCGLYTSPHLTAVEERMAIDGQPCPPETFAALIADLAPAVEQIDREQASGDATGPTFFEITTAAAFLYFARARVDMGVLEVGLGGRLDSTNVCVPEVSIITSISFDHVRQLGNTLAAIAGEKAGIIKPYVPVVSGVVAPEPRDVIAERALALNAPLLQRGRDYDFSVPLPENDRTWLDYREPANSPAYELPQVELGMLGEHQAANAAAAICAVRRLRERGWAIDDGAVRRGLAAARSPARIEIIAERPTVILDVAHNVASIEALLAVLKERFAEKRRVLIFASSKDKDHAGMLERLLPAFDAIILTQYVENPRAMTPEALVAEAAPWLPGSEQRRPTVVAASDPRTAWQMAGQWAAPDDLVVITGSFFLAAELRPQIAPARVEGKSSRLQP